MRVYLQAAAGCSLVVLALSAGVAHAATAEQRGLQRPAATLAQADGKHPLGVVPHGGAGAQGAAAPTGGSRPAPGFDEPPITGALGYHGGRVMHSNTVHTFFWDPTSLPAGASHFSASYVSLVNQFVSDIATDSPGPTNVFGSDAQYTDSTLGHISGTIAYGGTYTDTNSFPDTSGFRGDCFAPAPCLTDTQLETELRTVVIPANGWPTHTWTNSYAIMTPPGVNVCIDWAGFGVCSTNVFCAYHTWGDLAAPATDPIEIYAVEPAFTYGGGCDLTPAGYPEGPNGDVADITINTLSHELNEAITDPTALGSFGGWFDSGGNENGDKCAYNFGSRVGSTVNGDYNQVVNGHPYLLQREWSNGMNGCYQTGAPTISNFAPGAGAVGDSVVIHGTNFFWACSASGNPCSSGGATAPVVKFNGVASPSVTVDSPTQLTATVPSGNATGKIAVQGTITGNVTSAQTFGLKPVVSGFGPGAGFAGQVITVNGTGFFGVTSVKINGVAGAVSSVALDGTSLHVTIPAAATTGKISVTTAGGTGTSSTDLTIQPHVTSITPAAAIANSNVTILGTGLGGATVDFTNSPNAAIVSQTGTSITVKVPVDAHNGTITVHTAGGDSMSAAVFKPLPKILNFDHATYQAGDTVTVNGSNFQATGSDPTVKLGVTAVAISAVSDTSFQFVVPDAALTASVSATNANGTTISPSPLKVRPTISVDPAPNEAAAGVHITLTGKTFTGTSSVKFNGTVPAAFMVGIGGTTLTVTVPAAAIDGLISVTNAGGTTQTANPFLVDGHVTSFSPSAAQGGANVTINGTGFGLAPVVHFTNSSAPAVLVSNTPTTIVAKVPADARNGPITVTSPHNDSASVAVFKSLMKILSFDQANYQAGNTVTVTGSNFLATGFDPTAKLGATVVIPNSVTDTSFQLTVPDNALTASLSVTNANGTTMSPTTLKVRPTITGDPAPNEAAAGTHVVLSGKTFSGTTSVRFNGTVPAAFIVGAGGLSLNVTVPAAAIDGQISVTNAGGTTQTANPFLVDGNVTSFAPSAAAGGSNVTINGTGFGVSPVVNFTHAAAPAAIVSHSATMIVATVPTDARNGSISVTTAHNSPVSAAMFKPQMKILSFDQAMYQVGNTVTVNGSDFLGTGVAPTVKLGAIVIAPTLVTDTSLQFVLPDSALTATLSLTNGNGTANSPTTLKVRPTISSGPLPNEAATGTHVTINGKSFTGTTSVKFNGVVPAAFVVGAGGNSLDVTVPTAAPSGAISVTNAGGTTQTAGSFTVDPRITGFSPASGTTGTLMTVNGSGLLGADRVDFPGGVSGVPTNVAANQLKVAVPAGTTVGHISVHTAAGSSPPSAGTFTVTFSVTSISPIAGGYNADVTINGVGLTGVTAVKFNGVAGAIASNTGSVIKVTTPASGTISGHVTVWKSSISVMSPNDFTLLTVDSFNPSSGTRGKSVRIAGHGFTGATHVSFGGTDATTFSVDSDTQITAEVPERASNGHIGVTIPGGTATSNGLFTVEHVTINEIQTAGTTTQDEFVEIANTGPDSVDISGCTLNYRTAAGTTDTLLQTVPASTTLDANHFYVFGGTDFAGTKDAAFSTDLSETGGGLALSCYTNPAIVDSMGWGTATNAFVEGTAASPPPTSQSIGRQPDGTDTGNNSADFQVITTPTPGATNGP